MSSMGSDAATKFHFALQAVLRVVLLFQETKLDGTGGFDGDRKFPERKLMDLCRLVVHGSSAWVRYVHVAEPARDLDLLLIPRRGCEDLLAHFGSSDRIFLALFTLMQGFARTVQVALTHDTLMITGGISVMQVKCMGRKIADVMCTPYRPMGTCTGVVQLTAFGCSGDVEFLSLEELRARMHRTITGDTLPSADFMPAISPEQNAYAVIRAAQRLAVANVCASWRHSEFVTPLPSRWVVDVHEELQNARDVLLLSTSFTAPMFNATSSKTIEQTKADIAAAFQHTMSLMQHQFSRMVDGCGARKGEGGVAGVSSPHHLKARFQSALKARAKKMVQAELRRKILEVMHKQRAACRAQLAKAKEEHRAALTKARKEHRDVLGSVEDVVRTRSKEQRKQYKAQLDAARLKHEELVAANEKLREEIARGVVKEKALVDRVKKLDADVQRLKRNLTSAKEHVTVQTKSLEVFCQRMKRVLSMDMVPETTHTLLEDKAVQEVMRLHLCRLTGMMTTMEVGSSPSTLNKMCVHMSRGVLAKAMPVWEKLTVRGTKSIAEQATLNESLSKIVDDVPRLFLETGIFGSLSYHNTKTDKALTELWSVVKDHLNNINIAVSF